MDRKPYDPAWLVEWVRANRPDLPSLADALARCTRADSPAEQVRERPPHRRDWGSNRQSAQADFVSSLRRIHSHGGIYGPSPGCDR